MAKVLYVSTQNSGKLLEIKSLCEIYFPSVFSNVEALKFEAVVEDENSFIGNAQKKTLSLVRGLLNKGENDFCVIGDDSGLCVDALNGQPGLLSARWAGANASSEMLIQKLLKELAPYPKESQRGANFTCALSFYFYSNGKHFQWNTLGKCFGQIGLEAHGSEGFGYDPVFYLPPLKKTFAQMSAEEKNIHSHRSQAFSLLQEQTKEIVWHTKP